MTDITTRTEAARLDHIRDRIGRAIDWRRRCQWAFEHDCRETEVFAGEESDRLLAEAWDALQVIQDRGAAWDELERVIKEMRGTD